MGSTCHHFGGRIENMRVLVKRYLFTLAVKEKPIGGVNHCFDIDYQLK